ncbi:hypothetical protein H8959_016403 [Pygathrix nigripes]
MIADFLVERKTISFDACLAQIFFVHLFTGSEMVLLVSMAYDRCVAICKPLHYMTIMSRRVCVVLVLISWSVGFIHTTSQLAFTVNLPFSGPNKRERKREGDEKDEREREREKERGDLLGEIDSLIMKAENSSTRTLSFLEGTRLH